MEATVSPKRDDGVFKIGSDIDEYREAIRKLIDTEVKNALDEEIRNATKELIEEHRKAIKQIVEEHKLVIREVVEEEKKAIGARAEALPEINIEPRPLISTSISHSTVENSASRVSRKTLWLGGKL